MSDSARAKRFRVSGITEEIKDIIGAGALLVFAVLTFAFSFTIRKTAVSKVGSEVFPRLIGAILVVIGIALMIDAVKRRLACRRGAAEGGRQACEDAFFDSSVVLTPVYILGYFLLVVPLGFLVATTAYLALQIRALAVGNKKGLPVLAAVAFLFSAAVYFLFRIAFNLYLPAGILAGLING